MDSFNFFVDVELKKILKANEKITVEEEPDFYMKYTDIRVGEPETEDNSVTSLITPQQCRLRDITYSAPITVDVEYAYKKKKYTREKILIGKMPVMLGSNKCVLYRKSKEQLATYGECPHDPGGYFIVRGVEKVILVHEQLSKNRIILEVKLYYF